MDPLDLVKLTALMQRTSGRAEIMVGLIDGPVAINHPDLVSENIREVAQWQNQIKDLSRWKSCSLQVFKSCYWQIAIALASIL